MSRTTIDGLIVRTSNSTERVNSVASTHRVVGGHLMDDVSPTRHSTAKVRTYKEETMESSGPKMDRMNTLDKIEGEGADWSDLLAQIDDSSSTKKQTTRTEELITEDDETPKPHRRKKSKTKKKKHIVRKILLVLLVLILVGGVAVYFWGDSLISRLTNGKSNLIGTIWSLMSEEIPFETDANGRTNVLVFGTEGYDMNGTSGNGVHDGAALTDSIMIVSFDQETKDVALLSLPRDLKVGRAACYAGKVNEVFTCGNTDGQNEEAGAEALMNQVGQVLGIDFQYWAHVNWGSLVEIVDTIGGITIVLDEGIYDYEYTGVVIEAGVPTHLDGEQVLGLSRARHGTNGGDFTRGTSQQKIVMAIVQKMIDNGVGLSEALNLLNILGDNLRTNFSSDNIKAGIHLMSGFDAATGIRNVPLIDYNSWQFMYITTATINEISYVVPADERGNPTPDNYTRIHEYVSRMFSSNPAVREGAEIAIFNATNEAGVAGAEQARLEAEGYTIYNIGNAAEEDCTEKYCLYAINSEMSGTLGALEKRYSVTAKPASELPGDIMVGYADFVVIIGQVE